MKSSLHCGSCARNQRDRCLDLGSAYYCWRPKGHPGDHIACRRGEHKLSSWINAARTVVVCMTWGDCLAEAGEIDKMCLADAGDRSAHVCTRRAGHAGPHGHCEPSEHLLHEWASPGGAQSAPWKPGLCVCEGPMAKCGNRSKPNKDGIFATCTREEGHHGVHAMCTGEHHDAARWMNDYFDTDWSDGSKEPKFVGQPFTAAWELAAQADAVIREAEEQARAAKLKQRGGYWRPSWSLPDDDVMREMIRFQADRIGDTYRKIR